MDIIIQTCAATSSTYQLQMYHRYKHQRATQHIIELYETCMNNPTDKQKLRAVTEKIENINTRTRALNGEYGLPSDLGLIDYGTLLYGWEHYERSDIKEKLERLCTRRQYMQGWSCIPPRHDYGYFDCADEHHSPLWDILIPWLRLAWGLMKGKRLDWTETIEAMLISYMDEITSTTCYFDAKNVLTMLHQMSKFLGGEAKGCIGISSEYDRIREELRRMCEFEGFPSRWIPGTIKEEQA